MQAKTASLDTSSAPLGADYFSVFSLPRKLVLDTKALERAFYRRSREVHPDRFAQAGAEKQQWSLEQTSLLNDAYRALKDPIARTEYLLRLQGVTLADDAAIADRQEKKQVPPELLAEVFELNMQLEEMRMNAQLQFSARFSALDRQIEAEWDDWDRALEAEDDAGKQAATARMASLLDTRRYIRNLLRDVTEALGTS